ncbi:hypothetical protein H4219_003304 [Mycoemilia scoparia]|uniref:Uncharacterized protein n=1 Tax=Mycoemilia scoparia TaxID=417184 RepID=A0A9W8A1N6_9FUNG|nr:hypothetical protein H4219_003304 [Mycoemilia scoparia]
MQKEVLVPEIPKVPDSPSLSNLTASDISSFISDLSQMPTYSELINSISPPAALEGINNSGDTTRAYFTGNFPALQLAVDGDTILDSIIGASKATNANNSPNYSLPMSLFNDSMYYCGSEYPSSATSQDTINPAHLSLKDSDDIEDITGFNTTNSSTTSKDNIVAATPLLSPPPYPKKSHKANHGSYSRSNSHQGDENGTAAETTTTNKTTLKNKRQNNRRKVRKNNQPAITKRSSTKSTSLSQPQTPTPPLATVSFQDIPMPMTTIPITNHRKHNKKIPAKDRWYTILPRKELDKEVKKYKTPVIEIPIVKI